MLKVTAEAADPREIRADLLVVPVFKGGIEGPGAQLTLAALDLERFPITPSFRGDIGQSLLLAAPGLSTGGVLLVGLGRMDEVNAERLRSASGVAAKAARSVQRVATTLPQVDLSRSSVEAVAEGFVLGAHADTRFKTRIHEPSELNEVVVLVPSSRLEEARRAIEHAAVTSGATLTARDLVNLPPDRKRPPELAQLVSEAAGGACDVRIRGAQELAAEGFGAITAVGRGSSAPPHLVELRYTPADPIGAVVLVGKGITFDTGGINLKRGNTITQMKGDMAGAAAVAATCAALADLGVRLRVTGLCPLAENMPGADAQRPDDVLTTHGGLTVEVRDTDAEGRLVLADALDYGASLEPDAMVDVATLTGSAVSALGPYAAGVMGSDTELVEALRAAARVAGEDLWPLPLWPGLERHLDSPIADINNTGDDHGGGAIMGGLFLRRFTHGVPWAHLDIAGPAFLTHDLARGYLPAGGTGYGVRTLLAWLERRPA
ncbi:MAG: leucyl aminopeptidase [Nitriliruptorales bacterium]|nr:leucyl aminopeptidase [Nitriliruptorales bacterium]